MPAQWWTQRVAAQTLNSKGLREVAIDQVGAEKHRRVLKFRQVPMVASVCPCGLRPRIGLEAQAGEVGR